MPEQRVLVVEDDTSLRDIVAEALREDGYLVEVATDGLTALTVAARFAPDLVILDLMLPRLDGEHFCMAMRQIGGLANVPIIVTSASRTAEEVSQRLRADVALRKPFDLLRLTEEVERLLGPLTCA